MSNKVLICEKMKKNDDMPKIMYLIPVLIIVVWVIGLIQIIEEPAPWLISTLVILLLYGLYIIAKRLEPETLEKIFSCIGYIILTLFLLGIVVGLIAVVVELFF